MSPGSCRASSRNGRRRSRRAVRRPNDRTRRPGGHMTRAPAVLLAALAGASLVSAADAQEWPTRPVTLVVPYAAGGPVDTVGRIMAARLSELLGQQVIVENVGGAGGMTGAARVAKASPDGYTLLLSGSAVLAINQPLYKKPLY